MKDQLENLKKAVEKSRDEVNDMNNKIKKNDAIIKELEEENDYLKEDLDKLEKIADRAEVQTK